MKKMSFTYGMACLLLFAACKKNDCDVPVPPGVNEKEYMLKKVVHGTRQYFFYFNKKKTLDSIGVDNVKEKAVYRVFRHNNRIDSVVYFSNGSRKWFINNIQYDSAGNIKYFEDYYWGLVEPTRITYQQGHIHTIHTYYPYPPNNNKDHILTYNQQSNITTWSSNMPRTDIRDVKQYTYDNKYNPLYFIDDLLVIWYIGSSIHPDLYLSKHNSTTKLYELDNSTVTYQNHYDSKQRLIKKVFTERFGTQPDSLTFHYVK